MIRTASLPDGADANNHVAGSVDFRVLPCENADDGTEEQYALIRRAIEPLSIPLEIRPGDHDRKSGTLQAYARLLEPRLYHNRVVGPYRCDTTEIRARVWGGGQAPIVTASIDDGISECMSRVVRINLHRTRMAIDSLRGRRAPDNGSSGRRNGTNGDTTVALTIRA